MIEFDPYPMPATKDLFGDFAKAKYFSKFDFFKAYHQIPTAEDSIKYTAFVCEWGLFEFTSMPLGIQTAAAWFQRCMDITFANLTNRNNPEVFFGRHDYLLALIRTTPGRHF